jgi:hypothetical protein
MLAIWVLRHTDTQPETTWLSLPEESYRPGLA